MYEGIQVRVYGGIRVRVWMDTGRDVGEGGIGRGVGGGSVILTIDC